MPIKNVNFKTKVLIVGAGPVGMTCSMLLKKLNVDNILIDKQKCITNLPQAHYISNRSMEVWRNLGNLDQNLQSFVPPLSDWRNFIYCSSLKSEDVFAKRDHFKDMQTCHKSYMELYSPCKVAHLPQNYLLKFFNNILEENVSLENNYSNNYNNSSNNSIINQSKYLLDTKWLSYIQQKNSIISTLYNKQQGNIFTCESDFLLATDGSHSPIRSAIGAKLNGEDCLQDLTNIYFQSKEFASLAKKNTGMLYFIFNPQVIAIMVAHNYERGEFVLQVPYFPGLNNENQTNNTSYAISVINNIAAQNLSDIKIKEIKNWKMSAQVSDFFIDKQSKRIILVGDSAHVIPPAGGLGMNLGIADAQNLCWKIKMILNNDNLNSEKLLQSYEIERKLVAQYTCQVAIDNFNRSLKIPSLLGAHWNVTKITANYFASIYSIFDDINQKNKKSSDNISNFLSKTSHSLSSLISNTFNTTYSLGLRSLPYYRALPYFNKILTEQIEKKLSNPFSNLSMLYYGVDLAYSYPSFCMKNSNINIKAENEEYYLKLSTTPFNWNPTRLRGCRIPHEYIYHHDQTKSEKTLISTIDLPFLKNPPDAYCLLIFDKDLISLTSKCIYDYLKTNSKYESNIFLIYWNSNNHYTTNKESFNNLNEYMKLEESEKNMINWHYISSSNSARDHFMNYFKHTYEDSIIVLIRPDSHILDYNVFNSSQSYTSTYKMLFSTIMNIL